jgi:hypothetical protein
VTEANGTAERETALDMIKDNAKAGIHHSNLGSLLPSLMISRMLARAVQKIPRGVGMLRRIGIADWDHARAKSITAQYLAAASHGIGLGCVGQEIISWGDRRKMIDCLSLLTKPGSCWDRPNVVVLIPTLWERHRLLVELHQYTPRS